MVDLKGFSKKYLYNGFGGGEASESAKLFDDTRECKFELGAFVFEDGKGLDDAYEHELDLLAEEFELPLGAMAAHMFGSTWVDDLVEESNRYFKSQYEEAAAAKRPALSTTSTDASASAQERARPAPVASLFQLSAAAVAAHLVPEVGLPGFGLPEEVLEAVQRRMPKERQIVCFGNYKRWEPRASVLLGLGGALGAEEVDVVRREREAWVLVKSCPYDGLGRKHGLAVEWRPDGSLWRTTRFEFGARSGTHVEYFADGRRALKACYNAGILHGNLKWWYDVPAAAQVEEPSSAMVVARSARKHLAGVQAYVNGRKEGEGRVWREDGTLWRTKLYRGDLKHGIWRTFDPSGRVIKCSRYDNGVKRKAGAAQLTTSCPGVALLLPSMDSASLDDRF